MSDPLWFLENLEENESKSGNNNFTLNYSSQKPTEKKESTLENMTNSPEDKTEGTGFSSDQDKQKVGENKITKVFELDLLKDEESLRSALQASLLESIKDVQNPEIQITVNSKPETSTTGINLENYDNPSGTAVQEDKPIVITLNKKENGQLVGEEKTFFINNANKENTVSNEIVGSNEQSKVYVILPPDQNTKPSVDSDLVGGTNPKYCEEIGSTVINLHDLMTAKENVLSENGNTTAKVDLSSILNSSEGGPNVELVIKVKDDRDKVDQSSIPEEKPVNNNYTVSEIARLKELLKSSATLESLNSQLQSAQSGKEVRDIPIIVTPSTSSQTPSTWQTTSLNSISDKVTSQKYADPTVDWTDKTTDSYVRRDGAQCTRTVWNSPQGRRVETKCFKDGRKPPRGRRVRDLDWSLRFGTFWSDIDDDFDFIFNRFF